MRRVWISLAAALALAGTGGAAGGQGLSGGYSEPSSVTRVDQGSRRIAIPRGKSAIIELPVDVRDVLVTNPTVADAVLRSSRRIYVMGMASGQTDAVFFDGAGRRILSLDIRVDQDTGALADTIARVVPGAKVSVESINDSVILTGQVASLTDADKAVQIAQRYVAKPENVLNMLSIAVKDQVMLKVRIVEMQRSVIKQFGVNLSAVYNQVGEPQYIFNTASTFAVNSGLLGGLSGGVDLDTTKQPIATVVDSVTGTATDIEVVDRNYPLSGVSENTAGDPNLNKASSIIQAFERVGLVRTLAEPNLTAVSGESAKFLAGGEYPVPVGQDNTGRIAIEFKPYGVGLGFTPVVLSGGRISLKISTEVSELSNDGAFTISNENSADLVIPALTVRRAESTVELPSGGSMMIAGLLQESTRQNIDSLPGMTNLPVLGALARSRDYRNGETELVVLISAYLVKPTGPGVLQTPADGLKIASDASTLLLGRLNKAYKAPPGANAGRTFQGPFGHVIE